MDVSLPCIFPTRPVSKSTDPESYDKEVGAGKYSGCYSNLATLWC